MTRSETTTASVDTKGGITPYLAMAGQTAAACDFYVRAFGANEIGRYPFPDGQPGLMHAQLEINGGCLCMTDCTTMSDTKGTPSSKRFGHLQLELAEGRSWWERAVAAGCTVLAAYERQPWGDD